MSKEYSSPEKLDQAVSKRLARLRAMPIDTSSLDQALRARLPQPPQRAYKRAMWLRPLRAVAAMLFVAVGILALLLAVSGRPVLASPTVMAQMHRDLVAQRIPVVRVDSIDQASQVLAADGSHQPDLPAAPEAHVMACCMREIKDKKVACVLLQSEGVPVTMTVAKAADMKIPKSPTVVRDGAVYHVQGIENLTMVMTERQDRWVCLISELPADRLIEIAGKLQF